MPFCYQKKCMFIVNCVLQYVLMKFWCKLPEDGKNDEICRSLVTETIRRLYKCAVDVTKVC